MNRQYDLMDYLNILSLIIGIMNLDENINQSDLQKGENELSRKMDDILQQIHAHLEKQDKDLEVIKVLLRGKEVK